MNRRLLVLSILSISLTLTFCVSRQKKQKKLKDELTAFLAKKEGYFAVAFKDLTTGDEVLINEHECFHAASTMKTPVMIEVFKQASEGKFSLTDSITIQNEFKSIVDGSTFQLDSAEDSYQVIYNRIGQKYKLSDLVYFMITQSSNLATDIVIEKVGAQNVNQTMRDLGAKSILVMRGVEDDKAYDLGLNNETTAFDLMVIYQKLALGQVVNPESSQMMINILLDQKINNLIPAKLPKDVKVSHKTGWVPGRRHDSGIVYLPDGRSYVIVMLSRDIKNEDDGIETLATVSEMIYKYVAGGK